VIFATGPSRWIGLVGIAYLSIEVWRSVLAGKTGADASA